MRSQKRINFMSGIDKQVRRKTESNILNSVNQQTLKMNKGERKEQAVIESPKKNNQQYYRNQQTSLNNYPKCK
jgi:hypothetical protein